MSANTIFCIAISGLFYGVGTMILEFDEQHFFGGLCFLIATQATVLAGQR